MSGCLRMKLSLSQNLTLICVCKIHFFKKSLISNKDFDQYCFLYFKWPKNVYACRGAHARLGVMWNPLDNLHVACYTVKYRAGDGQACQNRFGNDFRL